MENNGFALKVFQEEVCDACDCQTVETKFLWHQDEISFVTKPNLDFSRD
jgi:hypothetical protein